MFRRKWSGLPRDYLFPSNLEDLGYFINEDDEIRSVADPDRYFKYWIDKNMRVNGRQRFHFNGPSAAQSFGFSADRSLDAVQDIVHARLEAEGLEKHSLPFGSKSGDAQVTIFASADLHRKSRVTVIFGEPNQSLGILALRVANGPGGINMGTMVSVVQTLKQQISSPDDSEAPGIILCNVGAVFWWPEEERTLTLSHMSDMPLASLAHHGRRITTANQHARAYITSEEPAGMPLAGPHGNSKTSTFLNHGTAAVYSSGEPYYVEMILVRARESILGWLGEVAATGFDAYQHPEITVVDVAPQMEANAESVWANVDTEWGDVPVEVKPSISFGGDGSGVPAAAEPVIGRRSETFLKLKSISPGLQDQVGGQHTDRWRGRPWHLSSPQTHVSLTHAPLSATAVLDQIRSPRAGALVLFAGTTRDSFAGKPVRELHYSAYAPRALRTMAAVAEEVCARHGLEGVAVVHRLGTVPVGEESVLIGVAAAHRGPAWRAGEEALELVKERVEVWKREEFFGEEGVWRANRDGAQGVYETGTQEKKEESVSGQGQEQKRDVVAETPGREEMETAGDSQVAR
ncbi:hypothetical protein BN1708_003650 [Verticillium longisporum]|uniref:Molybdopterin synthase catalytic subunit n=1 Tax=Verticillium longisporum TaxID=100787 RepID=A0A0G4LNX1_VERLO|nr:hypothetical protein BN1708_003650 [Verticillium longisporum]